MSNQNENITERNEIIREIFKYVPNTKIKIKQIKDIILVSIDDTHIIIHCNDTWNDVKNKIDRRVNDSEECAICLDISDISTPCFECNTKICVACVLTLIIKNQGVNVCSFCRCRSGKELDVEELFNMVTGFIESQPHKYRRTILEKMGYGNR